MQVSFTSKFEGKVTKEERKLTNIFEHLDEVGQRELETLKIPDEKIFNIKNRSLFSLNKKKAFVNPIKPPIRKVSMSKARIDKLCRRGFKKFEMHNVFDVLSDNPEEEVKDVIARRKILLTRKACLKNMVFVCC